MKRITIRTIFLILVSVVAFCKYANASNDNWLYGATITSMVVVQGSVNLTGLTGTSQGYCYGISNPLGGSSITVEVTFTPVNNPNPLTYGMVADQSGAFSIPQPGAVATSKVECDILNFVQGYSTDTSGNPYSFPKEQSGMKQAYVYTIFDYTCSTTDLNNGGYVDSEADAGINAGFVKKP